MSRYALCLVALYILAGPLLIRAGEFQAHVDYATGQSPNAVAEADFNRDGKPDLCVANLKSNTLSVLLGHGDGTFGNQVDYATGAGPNSVAIGDFNADGKADVVVVNSYVPSISVLLGNGDGTFQTHVDYPRGAGAFPCCSLVGVSDLDFDGNLDLVVANYGPDFRTGTASILLGNGGWDLQAPGGISCRSKSSRCNGGRLQS